MVALAGFLFGFDTVVISGADQQLQELWQSSSLFHGVVVMATALWGTVVGAILGGTITNKYGRKNTLLLIGGFYFVSALGSALASDPYWFAFFRFLGGLGIGASTIAAPNYISEIAPAQHRGRLVAMYQFNIVLGILIAFISNYFIASLDGENWRIMLGIEALPAILYFLLLIKVPKSPRWLILNNNRTEEAKRILIDLHGDLLAEEELKQIQLGKQETQHSESIFNKKLRKPLLLVFAIAFFNQFSGINAFLYYAPRIFSMAGLEADASFLSSIGVGIVNLVFTLIGVSLIDKFGRKSLMIYGSLGYIFSLLGITLSFAFEISGILIPLLFFVFIAAHAIGQGAVIWVFISELFPNHLRASGQAFGSTVHWVLAAIIPALMPFLFSSVGATFVFMVFTIAMVTQLFWVLFVMPETKGLTLEELANNFQK